MNNTRVFRFLSIALLAAIALYFAAQGYFALTDPFTTTLVYQSSAEDTIDVSGWLVRDEEVLSGESGTVRHEVSEGERVGKGQTVATVYSGSDALDTVQQIESKELQLQQLQFALSSYLNPDATLKLDGSITESLLSIRRSLSGGALFQRCLQCSLEQGCLEYLRRLHRPQAAALQRLRYGPILPDGLDRVLYRNGRCRGAAALSRFDHTVHQGRGHQWPGAILDGQQLRVRLCLQRRQQYGVLPVLPAPDHLFALGDAIGFAELGNGDEILLPGGDDDAVHPLGPFQSSQRPHQHRDAVQRLEQLVDAAHAGGTAGGRN